MPLRKVASRVRLPQHTWNSLPLSAIHPVSRREWDILGWVSDGKRDREIATILEISARTVEKHLQNIFRKLHVETRTAAAKWWHERNRIIERIMAQSPAGGSSTSR